MLRTLRTPATNARTANHGDSQALPRFFQDRAAIVARIADAEAQISKMSAESDNLLADLNSGPSLASDLDDLEAKTRPLQRIAAADKLRLAAMDKVDFEPAADAVRARLDKLQTEVIDTLKKAVRIRVSPWLFDGEGDAASIQNKEIDLDLLVRKAPAVRDEGDRQTSYFQSFADTKRNPAAWLPVLSVLLSEIAATESRLKLALALAADPAAPYDKAEFDRFDRSVKTTKIYDPSYEPPPSRSEILAKHRDNALRHCLREGKTRAGGVVTPNDVLSLDAAGASLRLALNAELKELGYEAATDAELKEAMVKLVKADARLAAALGWAN
jgi:hypothetical protein